MADDNFNRLEGRRGYQGPFTNVVILKKGSTGIFQASPVTGNSINDKYSLINIQSDPQESAILEHGLSSQKGQSESGKESASPAPQKSFSSSKKFNRLLSFLLIAGVTLLVAKHKKTH